MGTWAYMAPEQAMHARNADIRSDIYGLGVTLYQLLSNELPFSGENVMERLVARINQDAPPVSGVRPDVPPVLVHLIARMLHRDPAQRFQTPGEVETVLQSFVTNARQLQLPQTNRESDAAVSTLQAEADDTLNLFVGHLGTHARTQPVIRRRKKKTPWAAVISIAAAITIVCGVLYVLSKGSGPVARQPSRLAGAVTPEAQPADAIDDAGDPDAAPDGNRSGMSFPAFPSSFTNADARVAHWAIATASKVEIRIGQETSELTRIAAIPQGDFSVTGLDLTGLQSVTVEVLDQLTSATQLRSLNLSGGAVGDGHLDRLSQLQYIRALDLSNTKSTDAGLAHVVKMLQLTRLKLRYTEISTDGLQALAALSELANLDLEGTNVTNSIVESLPGLASLKELNLKHTRVTSVGADRIRAKLPDCQVLF